MLISIKLCTHWANRWWSRWDTTDAAVESVHSGEFPLHYNVHSFCASEIVTYIEVSASIARVCQILCSEYPFNHGNYWQTDWPSTLRYRITSKDSTDHTFIEQVQFTDSHRFFWKGSQKANCLSVYANEQSDRLLARPLGDKSLPHVIFNPPLQWQSQPIPFAMHYTLPIYVGIVKLSIVRGSTWLICLLTVVGPVVIFIKPLVLSWKTCVGIMMRFSVIALLYNFLISPHWCLDTVNITINVPIQGNNIRMWPIKKRASGDVSVCGWEWIGMVLTCTCPDAATVTIICGDRVETYLKGRRIVPN
jgi:hypothetical protein